MYITTISVCGIPSPSSQYLFAGHYEILYITFSVCGFPSTSSRYRIVGGSSTGECEFPWMAGVTVNSMFCGGAIISEWHILTAAHCLKDR